MILSHKKKFIFVHNYKVAGSSIKKALNPYAHKPLHKMPISSYKYYWNGNTQWAIPKPFRAHCTAAEIAALVPEKTFKSYYKFGFVRNPWSWQASLYRFMVKTPSHFQHEFVKSLGSFENYMEWRISNEVRLQKRFFYDEEGNCLMDYIGKFENLHSDFETICETVGIQSTLEHINSSTSNPYKYLSLYNQATLDMVEEAFKEDIALFGYQKPVLEAIDGVK